MNAEATEVAQPVLSIDQKIVGWKIKKTEDGDGNTHTVMQQETLERPEMLVGNTYKISPSVTDSAMYITINNITMDDGTLRPFEIFISSKHVAHQQWITAITRMISAIWRKGGDFLFVAEELEQIFDPQGGYFANQRMMPSVVAHVGAVLKKHFIHIGALEDPSLSEEVKLHLVEKKKEAATKGVKFQQCLKCLDTSMVMLDGCMTCTSCGDSKCG